jgi:hypothetical protein
MDGLSLAETCIIIIVNLGRAFLGTEPTGNTFLRVYITGILDDFDFETALLPGDALHL